MKALFSKYSVLFLMATFFSLGAAAQQATPADSELGNAYDLYEVTQEWKAWFKQPTPANAFIGEFMQEFDVPQSGQDGLNRVETWYWWASHHPVQVGEYIERRDSQPEMPE